jgi:hypothetical protein
LEKWIFNPAAAALNDKNFPGKFLKDDLYHHPARKLWVYYSSLRLKFIAMKKIILSVALLLTMSGYAAAQTSKTQQVSKTTSQKAVKKGTTTKISTKTTQPVIKEKLESTSAHQAKLNIILPAVDTNCLPAKPKN